MSIIQHPTIGIRISAILSTVDTKVDMKGDLHLNENHQALGISNCIHDIVAWTAYEQNLNTFPLVFAMFNPVKLKLRTELLHSIVW